MFIVFIVAVVSVAVGSYLIGRRGGADRGNRAGASGAESEGQRILSDTQQAVAGFEQSIQHTGELVEELQDILHGASRRSRGGDGDSDSKQNAVNRESK